MTLVERVAARYKRSANPPKMRIEIKPHPSLSDDETDQLKALSRGPHGGSMHPDLTYGKLPGVGDFVAIMGKEGDEIVGWWSVNRPTSKNVVFVNAFTSPKHRKKGIGVTLGREAIRYARSKFKATRFVAMPEDSAGNGLYSALGFEPLGKHGEWVLDLSKKTEQK